MAGFRIVDMPLSLMGLSSTLLASAKKPAIFGCW